MINREETIRDKGILSETGSSIPFQMLISICSKPIVRKRPARIEMMALKMRPTYRTNRTGIESDMKKARIIFFNFFISLHTV